MTIFCRSSDVRCFSKPRLRVCTESCRAICGREMPRGADVEEEMESNSKASSSAIESMLPERSGTSAA